MGIAIGIHCSRIQVGGQRYRLAVDAQPLLDVIDQQIPIAWRSARRQRSPKQTRRERLSPTIRGSARDPDSDNLFFQFSSSSTSRVARIERFLTARHVFTRPTPVAPRRAIFHARAARYSDLEQTLCARCASEETDQSVPPSLPYSPDC